MSKLKGILLTQGMHGMISQVEGLAKALDIDFTHHTVELNSFWKVIPPKFTPISQNVYKKINHDGFVRDATIHSQGSDARSCDHCKGKELRAEDVTERLKAANGLPDTFEPTIRTNGFQ